MKILFEKKNRKRKVVGDTVEIKNKVKKCERERERQKDVGDHHRL